MVTTNHLIAGRTYTAFHDLAEELLLDPEKNYQFDLSYLAVVDVAGRDPLAFLQGQLTCDVRKVDAEHFQQGAQCNLKGRILALMDIIDWQGVKIVLPQDLVEDTLHSLAKAALLSRVNLAINPSLFLFGIQSTNLTEILGLATKTVGDSFVYQENYYYALANNFYIVVTEDKDFDLGDKFLKRGSLAWHHAQLQQKIVTIYPCSRGLFLPHQLDLHKTEYVSFNKGCYKGQEIIARMHYRGKQKTELVLEHIEGITPEIGKASPESNEVVDYCVGCISSTLLGILNSSRLS